MRIKGDVKKNFVILVLICIIISAVFLSIRKKVTYCKWSLLKAGRTFGISGMVLIEQKDNYISFLVVHDNKKDFEPRLGIVTIKDTGAYSYTDLIWPADFDFPIDLEAVTSVPEKGSGSFMAMTSAGKIYHFHLDILTGKVRLLNVFSLPNVDKNANFEALAIKDLNGKLWAFWASRGNDNEPAVLYWAQFNLKNYRFSEKDSIKVKCSFPYKPNVRHISELKINFEGTLFISSASDGGDDGPFQSAVYVAGRFIAHNGRLVLRKNIFMPRLYYFLDHKVEGFEFINFNTARALFGSDDENFGSSLCIAK